MSPNNGLCALNHLQHLLANPQLAHTRAAPFFFALYLLLLMFFFQCIFGWSILVLILSHHEMKLRIVVYLAQAKSNKRKCSSRIFPFIGFFLPSSRPKSYEANMHSWTTLPRTVR